MLLGSTTNQQEYKNRVPNTKPTDIQKSILGVVESMLLGSTTNQQEYKNRVPNTKPTDIQKSILGVVESRLLVLTTTIVVVEKPTTDDNTHIK